MYKIIYIYILLMTAALALVSPQAQAQTAGGSLKELEASLEQAKTDEEKAGAGLALAHYYKNINSSKCVTVATQAIKRASKAKLDLAAAELNGIIGDFYFENKYYKFAVSPLENEYAIEKKLLKATQRSQTCYKLGVCCSKLGNNRKAKKYYDESWTLARQLGDKDLMNKLTKVLCDVAVAAKDYKKAYEYMSQYFQSETHKFDLERQRLEFQNDEQSHLIEMQDSTISEQKLQNELLEKDKEILTKNYENETLKSSLAAMVLASERTQKLHERDSKIILCWIMAFVAMLLLAFLLAFFMKRRANAALQSKNGEILRQNLEIESKNEQIIKQLAVIKEKNKDITDSLTYAGKIQKALLRTFEEQSSLLGDYFVFYAPKDIVSGDFYWCHKTGSKIVFTVGDCTGHSVPGAFMSMLGLSLLNQIVAERGITQASQILEMMRAMVKSYLGQTGINGEPKDGMDMALCVWDSETGQADFSGAYNPLIHIRGGEISVKSAVKAPVGIHSRELDFTDEYFQAEKGDRLFMFSDGYSDQFGGPRQEKFKMGRFRSLLQKTSLLPMKVQACKIKEAYYEWMGDFVQIDDVCVLGVEI